MMRRHLVYARFCVASGFSMVYPLHFSDASNTYDIANSIVIWPSFKKKLSDLFFQYHTKHTERRTGYLALFQYRSCFCKPSPTINPKSSAPDSQLMSSAVPAPVEGLRPYLRGPVLCCVQDATLAINLLCSLKNCNGRIAGMFRRLWLYI